MKIMSSLKLNTMKKAFEKSLEKDLRRFETEENLHQLLHHSLIGGGKRLRPILVIAIAEALKKDLPVMDAALSVEYFHTASLVADDLPCMDNEMERRGKPALHRVFGESKALLASYGLICQGFLKISDNCKALKREAMHSQEADHRCSIALQIAAKCSGFEGATLGQLLDMHATVDTQEAYERIVTLKTVTLFRGAFALGWIFGGGEIGFLPQTEKLAHAFGMAFQIRDDILDQEEDLQNNKMYNIALRKGEARAKELFFQYLDQFTSLCSSLEITSDVFYEICDLLATI